MPDDSKWRKMNRRKSIYISVHSNTSGSCSTLLHFYIDRNMGLVSMASDQTGNIF